MPIAILFAKLAGVRISAAKPMPSIGEEPV